MVGTRLNISHEEDNCLERVNAFSRLKATNLNKSHEVVDHLSPLSLEDIGYTLARDNDYTRNHFIDTIIDNFGHPRSRRIS